MKTKKIITILLILVSLFIPINSTLALSNATSQMYALNNILGYDSEDCDNSGPLGVDPGVRYKGSGNEHGHWDGSCYGVNGHSDWMTSQIENVQKVAAANGLPWELLMAQSIGEGGGGKAEICPYNSLGMQARSGQKHCANTDENGNYYAEFNNYEDMWQYYVDSISPIREAKNKFPQDPYSAVEFIEYGATYIYASSEVYVQSISAFICGVQKWAETNGYKISAVNYNTFQLVSANDMPPEEAVASVNAGYLANDCLSQANPYAADYTPATSIAEQAIKLSWPYNYEDGSELQGKCDPTGDGNLVPFDGRYNDSICRKNPKPSYKQALAQVWGEAEANKGCVRTGGPCDCTRFTTTVILSGGFDPDFPKANSYGVFDYLTGKTGTASKRWVEVSINDLQPGDFLVKKGHSFIYVGDLGGNWGDTAQASQGSTVSVVTKKNSGYGSFRAFRLKTTNTQSEE